MVFNVKNCDIGIRDIVVKMNNVQKHLLESELEPLGHFQLPGEVFTRELFLN